MKNKQVDQKAPDPILELLSGIRIREGKDVLVGRIRALVGDAYQQFKQDRQRFTDSRIAEKDAEIAYHQARIVVLSRAIRTLNEQHAEAIIEATQTAPPAQAMTIASTGNRMGVRSIQDVVKEEGYV